MRPVLAEIDHERARQDAKWGEQNHPFDRLGSPWVGRADRDYERCEEFGLDGGAKTFRARCEAHADDCTIAWWDILMEEVAEAIAAVPARDDLRAELVQVAAVVVAMIECLDRRTE